MTTVTLYHAPGCHLCDEARAAIAVVARELPFDLAEVDISGDAALEERYRAWLPVVDVDGEQAFVHFVTADAFRRRLTRTKSSTSTAD
jgi:glutaredoxin